MKTAEPKSQESRHSWTPNVAEGAFFNFKPPDSTPFFGQTTIQPKLKIGEPDDPYEKQADRVADAVTQMPDTAQSVQRQEVEEEDELQMKPEPVLQRKCKDCEEEEQLQTKSKVQTKSAESSASASANPLVKTAEPKSRQYEPGLMRSVEESATGPMIMGDWKSWIGNGEVVNNSSSDVTVWSSDRGTYTIPAHSSSETWGEDVDHVRDIHGHWWKIGWNVAVVDADGEVSGALCRSPGRGQDCGLLGDFPVPGDQDTIQTKLKVNQPNDRFEQEADTVADRVVNGEASIQRKCAACEEGEKLQKQPAEEEEELQQKPLVQLKASSSGGEKSTSPLIEQQINNSRGNGHSLPKQTRSLMENGIGANFRNVNVHTDHNAVQMNRELGARAFTVGNDIYFNSGEYNTSTSGGKHLLAHELTHVVQQNSALQTKRIQRTVSRLVGCDPGPFTSSGGTTVQNPAEFITQAETRAAELIQEAVDELNYTRNQIIGGEPAAWPVIGDQLAIALRLMGLNPDNRDIWVNTGIGTVHLLMRRLRAIRGTLTGTGIFYHCDPQRNVSMSPCTPTNCSGGGADAFSCAGSFRIILCDPFWSQPLLQERAVMLMHEHAHNFAEFIQDSGREGNAECYARFVIEANGLTSSAQSVGLCPDP